MPTIEEVKTMLSTLANFGYASPKEHWNVFIKRSQLQDALAVIEALQAELEVTKQERDEAVKQLCEACDVVQRYCGTTQACGRCEWRELHEGRGTV